MGEYPLFNTFIIGRILYKKSKRGVNNMAFGAGGCGTGCGTGFGNFGFIIFLIFILLIFGVGLCGCI